MFPFQAFKVISLAIMVGSSHGATGPGYAACLSACLIEVAGPACVWASSGGVVTGPVGVGAAAVWCAGVFTACAASCLCFDVTTMVDAVGGAKSIADLHLGDKVWGRDLHGHDAVEEILHARYIPGNFSFVSLHLANGQEITITTEHPVLTPAGQSYVVREARSMQIGEDVLTEGGSTKISAIRRSVRDGKFSIMTQSCTIYVGGVLIGTSCDRPVGTAPNSSSTIMNVAMTIGV